MKQLSLLALLVLPLCATTTVRVKTGGKLLDLTLEQYVSAVLAGESSVFQSSEALQAMAVAARTYAVRMRGRHSPERYDFCETTHCQRLELASTNPRVNQAAGTTEGELLWFQGKPAFTPYHRDCGGHTEASASIWPELAAAYLGSHPDRYCTRAGETSWQWSGDPAAIREALRKSGLLTPRSVDKVAIIERTASGRARTLLLSGGGESVRLSAGSFHFAIGRALGWNTLRSDLWEARAAGGRLLFYGVGSGHGVGLCQRGADAMGREGRSYREILAFYYPGTLFGLTGAGLSWQHLSGDRLSLWTVRPNQDKIVLASAERLIHALELRTHWTFPGDVEIRAYPDLDTFRDATGEPGWVGGYAQGRHIYLEPVPLLQSRNALAATLAHELAHILISLHARPDLPLWFREGLANYLAGSEGSHQPAGTPDDRQLRQTTDPQRARQAYQQATSQVAALVHRYSETTVLGWVKRGLPPEAGIRTAATNTPDRRNRRVVLFVADLEEKQ